MTFLALVSMIWDGEVRERNRGGAEHLENILSVIGEEDVADHSHAKDLSLMELIFFHDFDSIENINGRAHRGEGFMLKGLDGSDSGRELLWHEAWVQMVELKDLQKEEKERKVKQD
jgi:hypothetical protein